jgi:peptidoglycan/LPS O-acetylase OafA/YrhL
MAITWKDAVTTILAAATGMLAYAKYQNWQSWLIGPRLGIAVLGGIGMAMCAFGSDNFAHPTAWTVGLSVLGVIALVLVVAGLITGSQLTFFALAVDILALWLLSTLRHVAG